MCAVDDTEVWPSCVALHSREDVLRLLILIRTVQNSGYGPKLTAVHENLNSWIELKKFSGSSGWPTMVLVCCQVSFFFFFFCLILFYMVKYMHLWELCLVKTRYWKCLFNFRRMSSRPLCIYRLQLISEEESWALGITWPRFRKETVLENLVRKD